MKKYIRKAKEKKREIVTLVDSVVNQLLNNESWKQIIKVKRKGQNPDEIFEELATHLNG